MKKQIIFLGAFFLVLTLAGCGKKAPEAGAPVEPASEVESKVKDKKESEDGLFSGSIKELVARGKSSQCSFSIGDETGKMSGIVYVSGNKFSQEFSSIQGEMGEVKSYVLSDGEWIYQWNSLSKMGTKMKMAEIEKMAKDASDKIPEAEKQKANGGDFNSSVDYDCQKWNIDTSKFQLPANIQFSDFSQTMNGLMRAGEQSGGCQACDVLPSGTKEACLASCQK